MRRWVGFRGWAIVWAALQLALPVLATYADARVERESVGSAGAHVESTSTSSCRPAHAADCALCQLVSHAAAPSESAACPRIVPVVAPPAAAALIDGGADALARLPAARAPPIG